MDNTYVVLSQIRVVPLDAVVQYGDHHVLAGVAPLPGRQDVHLRATAAALIVAVLERNTDDRHPNFFLLSRQNGNDSL